MITNELLSRTRLMTEFLNQGIDINFDCGYPDTITLAEYRLMYDREGIAKRVVNILPDESWVTDPEIHENEDKIATEFEEAWADLNEKHHIFYYLHRVDALSGVGQFGILLLGLSDGLDLADPVEPNDNLKLIYIRAFDESLVTILTTETDSSNPRYGFPLTYSIKFETVTNNDTVSSKTKTVHYTRIHHVADNREVSEVFGVPRMKSVYNRLLDVRKVLSGSGEMFWKGAFPGYSFEINKDIKNATIDSTSLREEFQNYSAGLQRYIAMDGVSAKSLSPQVASPKEHLEAQMNYIAMTIGIPLRIFLGSEQAKLASTEDKDTWNGRVSFRREKYLTPLVINLLIDHLIFLGVLPEPEIYYTVWADLDSPSDKDKAEIGSIRGKALGTYVTTGSDTIVPPREFLTKFLGMSIEDADAIEKASDGYTANDEDDDATE